MALRRDWVWALAAIVLTALAQPHLFTAETLVSLDTATQYYPWYAYLGQTLRDGHIPGWNPATFSGAPFAANPLSGWTYLPAMVLFALLPMAAAVRAYLLFHVFLAAGGAFTLARVLGLSRTGALLAGVAYANTGFLQVQNVRSNPFASVYACLPVVLIGCELAVRRSDWRGRSGPWVLAAVAMSQIVAVWPGQGAYYSAMLVGAYVAARTLHKLRLARALDFVVHSAVVFGFAAALDAAGILPRIEFNALSNLAGGYTGAEASVGGLSPLEWLLVAVPGYWYVGLIVLALAVAAVFLAPACLRSTVRFFGLTSLGAVSISGRVETPLHWVLYHLLPGFAGLHPHAPERIMTVAYLGPALLAGVGLTALEQRGWSVWGLRLSERARYRHLASGLVLALAVVDLAIGGARARGDFMLTDPLNGADKLVAADLATYNEPDGAARFLLQLESPARFIGYSPYRKDGTAWPYTTRFADPATATLEVNNRALQLRLQDAQGYDASHLQWYDALLTMANGHTQNYHDAEVFWAGLQSPLLDLLNVRYVIVPPPAQVDVSDSAALARFSRTVYSDARVRILENTTALPRAWIVHAATQATAPEALIAIDSGRVQPRTTAVLEEAPPRLTPPSESTTDRALVTDDLPDRMRVSTFTTGDGLLVLSEVYYPAWHAYVDGQPAHVYVADGALRAVAVPPGEHQVELRFESLSLLVGGVISVAAILALATLLVATTRSGRSRSGERQRRPRCLQ